MQVEKKGIQNDAVDQDKIRVDNESPVRFRNAANTADVNVMKIRTDDEFEMLTLVRNSNTPTDPTHMVNKSYVDDVIAGIRDPKDACRIASTGNVVIATGGLGAIDGVTPIAGDRVLLKDQTAGDENGIYVAAAGAWSRSTDADADAEVTQGLSVDIVEGTASGKTRWLLTTADPITVDTSSLTFVEVPTGANSVDWNNEIFTLVGGDITAQYVDLAVESVEDSVELYFSGIRQRKGTDYTLSTVALVTRITFAGDLATAGAMELVATDVLEVNYSFYP